MNNNLNNSNFNFNQVHDFNQYIIPNNNMNIPLNNAFNPNIYKNKEDRKGHTGFLQKAFSIFEIIIIFFNKLIQ